jgi:hypothetical protein
MGHVTEEIMKANWSDYEMYLKPVHLKGEARTFTITRITEEDTHPQPGKPAVKSPVLWFKEVSFGMILSPTNRSTLIALYGERVSDCLGNSITVKALALKVGGKDKNPLRIQAVRPEAPMIDVSTGEIMPVTYPEQPERLLEWPDDHEEVKSLSELDAFFGSPKITAQPELTEAWPATESEYSAWLKQHGWNGKETRDVLGTDAKSWLRMNAGKSWADVAKTIVGTLGKGPS